MSDVSLRLDSAQLQAVLTGSDGAAWTAVQRHGNRVLNLAISKCPVDEGRLRGSLTLEMRNEGGLPVARVGSNLGYAKAVHDGTGIYGPTGNVIRPVSSSVLRWPVKNNSGSGSRRYKGGQTADYAFAKYVRGVPGRPFLLDALREAR